MNKQIKEYLDLCEQKYKELLIADEEKDKLVIPPKSDFLTNKNEMDLIKKYLNEKDDLLKTSLLTLFKSNSVIVEGVLSVRNGGFRVYRGQYNLELPKVKSIIYDYCNYLELTEEEKDILDFCLKLVTYDDYSEYGDLLGLNSLCENRGYDLDKPHFLFDKDEKSFKSFQRIEVYPNGDIKFLTIDGDDYNNYLDEEQKEILIYHFQEHIKEMRISFDKELKERRIRLENEIKDIREKCGKYLLVASLRSSE